MEMEIDEQSSSSLNAVECACSRLPDQTSLKNSETDGDTDDEFKLSDDVLAMVREVSAQKEVTKDSDIKEDWALSQFWYTEASMETLAQEVMTAISDLRPNAQIACLSCPSLFRALLRIDGVFTSFHPHLYEFDTRFQAGNEDRFTYYDYNKPLDVPAAHAKKFDIVIADPPHLADSCFLSYAMTINSILKDRKNKTIFCTGVKMSNLLYRLFRCRETTFKPEHEQKLGNDFSCFTNYKPATFEWIDKSKDDKDQSP